MERGTDNLWRREGLEWRSRTGKVDDDGEVFKKKLISGKRHIGWLVRSVDKNLSVNIMIMVERQSVGRLRDNVVFATDYERLRNATICYDSINFYKHFA